MLLRSSSKCDPSDLAHFSSGLPLAELRRDRPTWLASRQSPNALRLAMLVSRVAAWTTAARAGGVTSPDSTCSCKVDPWIFEYWLTPSGAPAEPRRGKVPRRVDFEVDVREDCCKHLDQRRIHLGWLFPPIQGTVVPELALAEDFGAQTSRRLSDWPGSSDCRIVSGRGHRRGLEPPARRGSTAKM